MRRSPSRWCSPTSADALQALRRDPAALAPATLADLGARPRPRLSSTTSSIRSTWSLSSSPGSASPTSAVALVSPAFRWRSLVPKPTSCSSSHGERRPTSFVKWCARHDLTNVEVMEKRAEDALADLRTSFDVVVSRAVGPLCELLALSVPLVKRDGLVIAMKGPKGRAELVRHPEFVAAEGGRLPPAERRATPAARLSRR